MDIELQSKAFAAVLLILAAGIIYDQLQRRRAPPQRPRRAYRRRVQRRCWVSDWLMNRSMQGDYEQLLEELNKEADEHKTFKKFLRVDPVLFEELVERLTPYLKKKDTRLRKSIPVGLKVACTLRHLASGDSYASLSFSFRVSPSALCIFIPQVCQAIIDCYQREVLKCPKTPEEWKEVAEGFSRKWNYHNCLGALDGKHIGMKKPDHGGSVYFNYKKFNSIILMALVDANYKFLYVDVGAEGAAGDAGTWNRSPLHARIEEKRAGIPDDTPLPNDDKPMPYHIVGDDAFAMKPWLMKPYSHRSQLRHERIFSYRLSRARRVVENAFGILAMKFRLFAGHMLQQTKNVKVITMAGCVLHNLCLVRNPIPRNLVDHEDGQNNLVPGAWREDVVPFQTVAAAVGHNFSRDAKNMREYLAHYYTSPTGAVPWQERMVNQAGVLL